MTARQSIVALRASIAVIAAVGMMLGVAAGGFMVSSVDAASPALTMVAVARYDVQPAKHRVHVTVNLAATNHSVDTVIRRYYVDHAFLAVLPGSSAFKVAAVGSTAKPAVHVSSKSKTQTLLRIDLGTKLGSGKTLQLTLTFDLLDPGGAATRLVRIGDTLATFPVWAFGTTGVSGGSVTVAFPADYKVEVQGGPLDGPKPGTGGTQTYTSGSLSKPLSFVAYLVADRPGAYLETPLSLTVAGVPLSVVVRAWNDDAAFGKRTSALVTNSLPALGGLIGIPVPGADSALSVEEAITKASGGYAALYDVLGRRIVVAYDATPGVVIREAAHAWFNGALVADRWAAEGFAAYYAGLAAAQLKVTIPQEPLTKTVLAAKIPLNAWDGSGRPDPAVDAYVRAASLQLATLIADRAGPTGLTEVWRAAVAGEQADLPVAGATGVAGAAGAAQTSPAPSGPTVTAPDWRVLLDLLETRTNATYSDLWREWVVRPDEAALLTARTAARGAYTAALAEASGWALPATIRSALDAWQFTAATDLLSKARAVLASRPALEAAAAAAGLSLPATARTAFESSGPAAAAAEVAAEGTAIDRIALDMAARPSTADPVEQIGLIGSQPEASLAAARSAFASGDLAGAVGSADAARLTWDGARDVGRGRLAIAAAILAAFGVGLLLVTHGRDRRSLPAMAPIRTMPRMKSPVSMPRGPRGRGSLWRGPFRRGPFRHGSVDAGPVGGPLTAASTPPSGGTATPTIGTATPAAPIAAGPLPDKPPRTVVVPGRQPRPSAPPQKGVGALFGRRAPAVPPRPPMAHRVEKPPESQPVGLAPGPRWRPGEPAPGSTPALGAEGSPPYGTLAANRPGELDPASRRPPGTTENTASGLPSQPRDEAPDIAPGDDR